MNMFVRKPGTYDYDPAVVDFILQDEANPLKRISELIPTRSKVLDVGAGNGLLAIVMKAINKEVIIDGVEPDPHASSIARQHYRFFWICRVEDLKDTIVRERYDYIVMADVLEHFHDPFSFMKKLVSWKPEETKIVLSVPNIAFGAIRIDLLKGNFEYVDSGIIERTHLRFFTFKTLQELITSVGLYIQNIFFLQRDIFSTDVKHDIFDVGLINSIKLYNDKLSSTYQFLLVLTNNPTETGQEYFGDTKSSILLKYFISIKNKIFSKISKGRK